MRTNLDDPSLLQRHDAVALADGRKPMRDNEDGPSPCHGAQVALDDLLAFRVQCGSGLIKNEDAGLRDQSTRNGNTLALTA